MCDNAAVVHVLNTRFARDAELRDYAKELVDFELAHQCFLQAEWLPSAANVRADDHSKRFNFAEATITDAAFAAI